jgi:hypothetical protein
MTARVLTALVATAAAVALALATAAVASPVSSGKTKLALDPDTVEGFADMGIGITTTGAARTAQGFLKFPVKGGDIKPNGRGEVDHKGGIAFFREGDVENPGSVKFSQFIVKIGADKAKVFAKSDHAAVRLFDIDLEGQAQGRAFDFRIKDADTTLAKEGAQVLSDTFDFPFDKGIDMGHTTIKVLLAS